MPLIDGIKTFTALHSPDIRTEKSVILSLQDLKIFCRDFNLPLFTMENITIKDRIIEKKADLNMLFTWYCGSWIVAFEEFNEGDKDGQQDP